MNPTCYSLFTYIGYVIVATWNPSNLHLVTKRVVSHACNV